MDQYNKGMPYNWGGSCTIEEFDTGITAGKFAGNVPDSRDNGASKYCVGVDCSGLVTICWGVSKRLYTKSITEITASLDSMDLLQPGDIILLPESHVMIFINFGKNGDG
jgi:cell wall-associated NlpC family hydrolase